MACNCSKKAQPTGFAKSAPRDGAQAVQRSGATKIPGSVSAPLRSDAPPPSR